MSKPTLSVIVVAYNMQRELPRTVRSLSPAMQVGIRADEYELVIVDNGSERPSSEADCPSYGAQTVRVVVDEPNASPARAINLGLRRSKGDLVGVMLDGARLASPGLLAGAVQAAKLHPRPVIASLGFHLGSSTQMESVKEGYDQRHEDQLLESSRWADDGYRLFAISVFAGSSAGGFFCPMSESNGLFMPRALWAELHGCDEAFVQPGGGLLNLDLFRRACHLPDAQLVVLLGEGTFHQVHGGIATNTLGPSPWKAFHEEYVRLRGKEFAPPTSEPIYFGRIHPLALESIAISAKAKDAARWETPAKRATKEAALMASSS